MQIEIGSAKQITEAFIQSTVADEKIIDSKLALVVHSNHSGSLSCITRHTINNDRLGVGEIISIDDVTETFNDIQNRSEKGQSDWFNSFTDEHIIIRSAKMLVWHTPRQSRVLYLSKGQVKVTLPPLLYIFRVSNGHSTTELSVFALAANKRPNRKTKLYHAPLMNLYSNGKLCLGNMTLPKIINQDTIELVEKEFFNSRFTHPNHKALTRKPVDIEAFYKIKEKNGKRIMTSELMPVGIKLNDVLG
ncbi:MULTISPECIES: hypothetical protein [unclassified Shewanella]|uniref:hypothetical protein n=1 Tax=unclassified Shewanella TaxID=196818 RepID=UPI000CB8BE13|nr:MULTISPECIES: hypothetical protein [unclassified Shewanella]MBB1388317.1 hypothetical protein [Shewanella sp. SG44-6]PIX72248.1 MAG: hypothetical protein COZ42_06765 [Shewanella sp. CG_4_10_14_3_um_filter_42_91]PIY64988.1 MAG: hypothetical protein COY92_14200 [Shewanella sp. CG_4_10_14_0_8_um_filter_42_13]